MNPKTAYLENQINSATPAGLIVLLYEGLINFATTAAEELASENPDAARNAADAVDRCIRIITELNNSLNHSQAQELSERLSNLYAFFIEELSRALNEHSDKIILDILPLMKELLDGWKQAEQIVSLEQQASA